MSALLHTLVSLTLPHFQLKPTESATMTMADDLDDDTPVISLPCQWKAPIKRKESILPILQVIFEKHKFITTKRENMTFWKALILVQSSIEVLQKIICHRSWQR